MPAEKKHKLISISAIPLIGVLVTLTNLSAMFVLHASVNKCALSYSGEFRADEKRANVSYAI